VARLRKAAPGPLEGIDVTVVEPETPAVEHARQRQRLGEWLVTRGIAEQVDIEAALAQQRVTGEPLGHILMSRGILDAEDLGRALAGAFALSYRDLLDRPPSPVALRLLPEAFCRRRRALAVGFDGDRLLVAMSDPTDVLTLDDAQVLAGVDVEAVITSPRQLRQAIDDAFVGAGRASDPDPGAGPPAGTADDTDLNDQQVIGFVDDLLDRAVAQRASDVHLEPTGAQLRVRLRVDGVLHDANDLSLMVHAGVLNRVKIMAGLDIAEHRRPQDGRMSFVTQGRTIDARVATLPTVHGEALTLRVLDRDQGLLDVERLGLVPEALARLRSAYSQAWGLLLAVGPTGSGKSTTIYSILSQINDPSRNIVTVEDPVEYDVAGLKQTQVHTRIGYTFAAGLRSILRADPDVIVIGEIRNAETARTAAEAALTGHLVLSTLHANDAATAASRLLEMNLESYLVASALTCVVAQRLVRRLCPQCKVGYEPDEAERRAITMMAPGRVPGEGPLTLYRPGGCDRCKATGYFGRSAVYEVMNVTPQIRSLILDASSAASIEVAAVADGMQRLRQNGIDKVLAGETSVAELLRNVV